MPTKIYFGSGIITNISEIVKSEFKSKKPLIITDKGLTKTGVINKINNIMKYKNIIDIVEPNPKSIMVNRIGDIARKIKPDLIISLGGGSTLDTGKAVALLANNDGLIEDYEGVEKYHSPPLPILAIPTTCGTGSEVTNVSVITNIRNKHKMSIKGVKLFPTIALIDPDLLLTLPKDIIASTGMDALTHAIEAYISKKSNYISDFFAIRALNLILNSINSVFENIHNNANDRVNLMLGSTFAGTAFCNSDVGAVHCISESISGLFDISHGIVNSIFLPPILDFNFQTCIDKYDNIASLMGIKTYNKYQNAKDFISEIISLSKSLNIPSFRDLKIDNKEFPLISKYSYINNSNDSNPRSINPEDYLHILNNIT